MNIGALTITLGVDTKGLLIAETQVKQFTDKVKKDVATITPALQQPFQMFSKNAVANLATVSQRFRTFGYLASATITAPLTLAGKSIAKLASDYEFAMQKIVGLTGTAQSVVNQWGNEINQIAKEFGKRPQELAEGLYFIASSGIQGAEALDVLRLSAKAAASGLGETQVVANFLTSVLNAYRGTGLTAAYATDVLVAAVREGKAEATGFASAMGQVIPIASKMGVSIDQVAGGMAAITLTGSTAAQAATYLKGIFNALLKESEKGTKALTDESLALKGMNTSFGELRKILAQDGVIGLMNKLTELSKVYGDTLISKVFPDIRGMTGALSLMGKNMQYNSGIMQEITNSSGSLGKAWNAVADTIKIRYDRAMVTANLSMIELGKTIANTFLPILEWLVKELQKLTKWFESLSESEKRNKIITLLVVAALGPLSMAFSVLGYTLVGLASTINKVGGLFVWLSKTITASSLSMSLASLKATSFVTSITSLATAFKTLGIAILATPIGWFNIALGGAVAFMTKKVKEIKAQIKDMEDALAFTTPEMEITEDIGKKMYKYDATAGKYVSNLKNLNEQELSQLKNLIEQRLVFAQESLDNAIKYGKKEIENDEKILEQKKIIAEARARWESLKGIKGDQSYVMLRGSKLSLEIQQAEKIIKAREQEIEYNKTSAQATLDYYKQSNKLVDDQLKKVQKQNNTISITNKLYEDQIESVQEMRSILDQLADPSNLPKAIPMKEYMDALGFQQLAKAPQMPTFPDENFIMVDQVEKITNGLVTQTQAVRGLSNIYLEFFKGVENGWKNLGNVIIREIERLAATIAAKATLWAILNLISGGGVGTFMSFVFGVGTKIPLGAKGGIVPGGYPNDTYPALLSSGEKVIPKGLSDLQLQPVGLTGEVRFEIEGDRLVGILKKQSNRNSLY